MTKLLENRKEKQCMEKHKQKSVKSCLKLEMEKSLGARLDQDKVTVSEWLDRWMTNYMRKKLRPTVYPSYEMNFRLHVKPYIGHIALKSLQTDDLQSLFNRLLENGRAETQKNKDVNPGLSRRSVEYVRTITKEALTQAVHNNLIIKNPVDGTTLPPKIKKEVVPYTKEESEQFLNNITGHRLFAAYYLAFYTGLRKGEIIGLMWQDIDFMAGNFEVQRELVCIKNMDTGKQYLDFQLPKTPKSQRIIPLTDELVKVLKSHKAKQNEEKLFIGQEYHDENLVFCSEAGQRIWPRNFDRQYCSLIKQAGVTTKNSIPPDTRSLLC